MADPTQFASPHHLKGSLEGGGGAAAVSYGTDEGFLVTFREDTEYMEFLSKQAGHPIFRLRIMTNMISPGNTKTVWDHPTTGIKYEMFEDAETGEVRTEYEVMEQCEDGSVPEPLKYPKAWNRFLRRNVAAADGHPIEQWGAVTRTFAASLKAQNVHSIEQLAGLSDQNAQNIMGAIKYRDLAKAYLDERQKTRIVAREQELRTRAEERAADLARQVKELTSTVEELQRLSQAKGHSLPDTRGAGGPTEGMPIGQQLGKLNKARAGQKKGVKKGPPTSDDASIETAAA